MLGMSHGDKSQKYQQLLEVGILGILVFGRKSSPSGKYGYQMTPMLLILALLANCRRKVKRCKQGQLISTKYAMCRSNGMPDETI